MTAIFSDQIIQRLCIDQSSKKGKNFLYVSKRVESEIEKLSDEDKNFLATCLEFNTNFVTLSRLYEKTPKAVESRYRAILRQIKQRI